ncbi:nucleotidyltransferase [Franzmannia pantelleriensis]|uniref:nucleotidyltransferase n=1 Tax=Franzmannia pantelleriensis TaxID=48727 RepID=UPI000B7CD4A0
MHQAAVQWIVALLRDRNIPFLICGGLAAKGYGSERVLNDIDLFVPGEYFSSVVLAGQEYVSKAARHYREEGWDLTYVQFMYGGIKVEVGNADGPRIFDIYSQIWVPLDIDFSRHKIVQLLGVDLPLMLKEDLVRYKLALSRPVDIEDIHAIRQST